MSQEQLNPESVERASSMPMLGIGTWQNEDHDQCVESVSTALDMGYRHIDTAQGYYNEEAVGEGIEHSGVPREDVFLATKLWIENLNYDAVLDTTNESLDKLGVDTLDLLYVHWPSGEYDPEDTLPALEKLKSQGKIENIGVSNFEPEHLDTAREVLDEPIFANQVECSPLFPQEELRNYCDDHDSELVAYSPLARGEVFEVEELSDIAEKHDASEAQISLAWLREKGVTTIPKATSEGHIQDNWESLGVSLDNDDIGKIDAISREERQVSPDFAPW